MDCSKAVLTCLLPTACADDVVQLDANNMMAGQILMFELELVSIDPGMSGSTP